MPNNLLKVFFLFSSFFYSGGFWGGGLGLLGCWGSWDGLCCCCGPLFVPKKFAKSALFCWPCWGWFNGCFGACTGSRPVFAGDWLFFGWLEEPKKFEKSSILGFWPWGWRGVVWFEVGGVSFLGTFGCCCWLTGGFDGFEGGWGGGCCLGGSGFFSDLSAFLEACFWLLTFDFVNSKYSVYLFYYYYLSWSGDFIPNFSYWVILYLRILIPSRFFWQVLRCQGPSWSSFLIPRILWWPWYTQSFSVSLQKAI